MAKLMSIFVVIALVLLMCAVAAALIPVIESESKACAHLASIAHSASQYSLAGGCEIMESGNWIRVGLH